MERSQKKAREDIVNSSVFSLNLDAGGKQEKRKKSKGGGPDVPRLGGAWDHPVTLGSLSPWLGGGELGGVRGRGPQFLFVLRMSVDFYDYLGLALQTKKSEELGVFVLPTSDIKTTDRQRFFE